MAFDKLNSKRNYAELYNFWRKNPCEAALQILDVDLDSHQRVVLESRWKHSEEIDVLSRGTGKTFLGGVQATLEALLYPGRRIGLISSSFRQAKFLFAEVEKLYEKSPLLQDSTAKHPISMTDKCYLKFKSAEGMSGSVIEALPIGSDGGKIRGARYYTVIADEFAQIDSEVFDTVVRGFAATNQNPMENVRIYQEQQRLLAEGKIDAIQVPESTNRIVMSSTAYYQYNHLWTRTTRRIQSIFEKKKALERKGRDHEHLVVRGRGLNEGQIPARYLSDGKSALCAFTCLDVSEGFMNVRSIQQAKLDMPRYNFLMEYFCLFPSDSDGYFKRSLLDAARENSHFGPVMKPRTGYDYVMGIDPARNGDNFAIAIFECDKATNTVNLVRVLAYNKISFPEMHSEIRKIIKHYNVKYFKMDSGGGGTTIRDLLASDQNCPIGERLILEQDFDEHRAMQGQRKLGPLCKFSNYEWLKDANCNLRSALEYGRLKIASDAPGPDQLWTPDMEEANTEIETALVEMSTIITKTVSDRIRWDTPSKRQHKDRYSAILIGYDAALDHMGRRGRKKLATGSWG